MGNLQEQNDLLANTEPDVLMHDQTIPYYSRETVEVDAWRIRRSNASKSV
jgi:hypothetical protein